MTALTAAAALVLSGCQAMPQGGAGGNNSAVAQYVTSCIGGGILGVMAGSVMEKFGGKATAESNKRKNDLAKAAVAGCVIGVTATAIGRVLNERQQAKHEEALQKEARRRALEQQQYEAAVQRFLRLMFSTSILYTRPLTREEMCAFNIVNENCFE